MAEQAPHGRFFLTQAELSELLDELSSNSSSGPSGRRSAERYQCPELILAVMHPGGTHARSYVHPFDLSAKGVGFIHAGFLHVGSKCQLALKDADGGNLEAAGTVMNCTLLKGTVHRVGVEFEVPLDVDRILKPGGGTRGKPPMAVGDNASSEMPIESINVDDCDNGDPYDSLGDDLR